MEPRHPVRQESVEGRVWSSGLGRALARKRFVGAAKLATNGIEGEHFVEALARRPA
jgi:hypothetical protein